MMGSRPRSLERLRPHCHPAHSDGTFCVLQTLSAAGQAVNLSSRAKRGISLRLRHTHGIPRPHPELARNCPALTQEIPRLRLGMTEWWVRSSQAVTIAGSSRAQRGLVVPARDRRRRSASVCHHPFRDGAGVRSAGSLSERSGLSDQPSGCDDAEAHGCLAADSASEEIPRSVLPR
jgi:hypothetical protein